MDIFDLSARLSLDSSGFEKKLKAAGAAIGAVATAATATTVKLAKEAVSAYANYEQLVGGVETLFKDSADLVQQYAANAYKTAGLSANEYMETVTSFSASLLQSLGGDTERAASVADMAIRDMSDNANKMGTSMEAIQTAYQGFAKQNYTMLDNLKLGYGGTKSEMERLILDAEELSDTFKASRDENGNLTMSYADIVDAIHVVQDEIGITGTTAREASETISGSVAAAKSAWQNLVTGLADENADMTTLIDNFVESVGTAGKNILPRVEKALQGVSRLVSALGPTIAKSAPGIIKSVVPSMISAISDVVTSIVEQLPDIASPILESLISVAIEAGVVLADQAPAIITAVMEIIASTAEKVSEKAPEIVAALANGITSSLSTLVPVAVDTIITLTDALVANLPMIIDAAVTLIITLASTLTEPAMLGKLVNAAIALIIALANGLVDSLPRLLEKAPEIVGNLVTAIVQNAPKLWEAAKELVKKLAQGIERVWSIIKEKGPELINKLWDGIKSTWRMVLSWGKEILNHVKQGFKNTWNDVVNIGKDIVRGMWEGIKNMGSWLWNKVSGWVDDLVGGIKSFLGIASPSKVFAQIGEFTAMGFGEGFDREFSDVADDVRDKMASLADNSVDLATNLTSDASDPLLGGFVTETEAPVLYETLNQINSTLSDILDNLGFDIVLNDGAIAGRVDKLLGQTALRKARGNA